MPMHLSENAELAVKYVNTTNRNIFLTGKAGSGKTTLLKYILDHTYKNTVVAAPTGIAAINAGGVTLHSLLQLPFGAFVPENTSFDSGVFTQINTPHSVTSNMQMSAAKRDVIKEMELLIIDEVSMLRADLLDCINLILQHVRKKKQLFGGVQVLFIGDLNQLPPVVRHQEWNHLSSYYESIYFFDSHAIRSNPCVYIELEKIYRQSDSEFIEILNRLRDHILTQEDILRLNSHYKEDYSSANDSGFIHITTHNKKSDKINDKELRRLEKTAFQYAADITGDFPENMFPLPQTLIFKEGSQVMFIKNDPSGEGQFFNGKIGKISSLSDDHIDVKLLDEEKIVHVQKYTWENKKYSLDKTTNEIEETIVGSFDQYPLRLAWSITVHKSQGLTFENAILDLTDSFAPGQMYVALSRLTSLKGLILSSPIPNSDLKPDQALQGYSNNKIAVDELAKRLHADTLNFIIMSGIETFDLQDLLHELEQHLKGFTKEESRSEKQKHANWTLEVREKLRTLQDVALKFHRELYRMQGSDQNFLDHLQKRIDKAEGYFIPQLIEIEGQFEEHLKNLGKKSKVKSYVKEVKALEALLHKKIQRMKKGKMLIQELASGNIPDKSTLRVTFKTKRQTSKRNTKFITLDLYREGMNMEQIANERNLAYGTIEGHMALLVADGTVNAFDLMSDQKIENILKVSDAVESEKLNDIKSKLGDEYSFGEIKMALAYRNFMQNMSTEGKNPS